MSEKKQMPRTLGRRLTNDLDSLVTAAHSTPYVEKLGEIERTIDALVAALEQTRKQLHKVFLEGGGCDHSVGICWCEEQRALDAADAALKSSRGDL